MESSANDGGVMHLDGSPIVGDKPSQVEPIQLDKKEKMTYTEQAAKRKHCQRLTRFAAALIIIVSVKCSNMMFKILMTLFAVLYGYVTTL